MKWSKRVRLEKWALGEVECGDDDGLEPYNAATLIAVAQKKERADPKGTSVVAVCLFLHLVLLIG